MLKYFGHLTHNATNKTPKLRKKYSQIIKKTFSTGIELKALSATCGTAGPRGLSCIK